MERIEELGYKGLKFIQDDDYFCFGCDSVELANFIKATPRDKVVDLGSGSGIIPVLLAAKKQVHVTAVEIQPALARLNQKNVQLNNLNHLITVVNMPMQQLFTKFTKGQFSIVASNPPYFKTGSGEMSQIAALSRHEVAVTQRELVKCASDCLSTGGSFYVVYPTVRMAELLSCCTSFNLEPKELVILNAKEKPPHLFLLRCVKDGKVGLKVQCRPLKTYGMD